HGRLGRAVGGDAARLGAENRASPSDLHRSRSARLRPQRKAIVKARRTTQSRRVRRVFFGKAFCVLCGSALIVVSSIAVWGQTTPKFDSSRAWEHLRQMVAIGPRPAGSPAIEQTRKYIKDELAKIGLKAAEQAWDDETPLGKVHMVNLIVTIPGASKDRLAVTGHYDTKLFREFRFVGASDGGSSAAF